MDTGSLFENAESIIVLSVLRRLSGEDDVHARDVVLMGGLGFKAFGSRLSWSSCLGNGYT